MYAPSSPSPSSRETDSGLVRQPDPVQRREQEVARAVAGEDPAGPVAAVRRRREPEDQHPRRRIAEALHRPAPVVPVAIRRPLLARDLLAPLHEPRAAAAVDDRLVERFQGGHGRFDASCGYALNRMRRIALIAVALALPLTACGAAQTSESESEFKGDQAAVAEVVDQLAAAGRPATRRRSAPRSSPSNSSTELKSAGGDCVTEMDRAIDDASDFDLRSAA